MALKLLALGAGLHPFCFRRWFAAAAPPRRVRQGCGGADRVRPGGDDRWLFGLWRKRRPPPPVERYGRVGPQVRAATPAAAPSHVPCACCVLRFTCCMLHVAFYMLRFACCLRLHGCMVHAEGGASDRLRSSRAHARVCVQGRMPHTRACACPFRNALAAQLRRGSGISLRRTTRPHTRRTAAALPAVNS
jgi:hypothetical protein